jgi:cytochrome P450
MDDEIATRKEDLKEGSSEEKRDIFSRLVEANEEETTRSARLDDSELIGNTFLMLLAGHGKPYCCQILNYLVDRSCADTTANTLAASIAFLALHEEEQEKIYKHIQTVLPDGRDPVRALPSYEMT